MANFLFVDNSNLWIEGKRASAVRKGMSKSIQDATTNGISDPAWSVDFGKLISFAGGEKSQLKAAYLYGSRCSIYRIIRNC